MTKVNICLYVISESYFGAFSIKKINFLAFGTRLYVYINVIGIKNLVIFYMLCKILEYHQPWHAISFKLFQRVVGRHLAIILGPSAPFGGSMAHCLLTIDLQ